MKKITALCSIVLSVVAFVACEKSKDFMRDNPTPTGKGYYPVSTNGLVDLSDNKSLEDKAKKFAAGSSFKTELQYMSEDKIKEINFYATVNGGTRDRISSTPYAPSFSPIKRVDTMVVSYSVPVIATSGAKIKLEFEIKNENTLSVIRTATITVQ